MKLPVVYITKYALTSGLIEAEVIKIDGRTVVVKALPRHGLNGQEYFHKPNWYTSKDDALNRVSEMVKKKEKSLSEQTEKFRDFRLKEQSWIVSPSPNE